MNQDTMKSFFVKLGLISLAGAAGWHFLVGAELESERDLKLARQAQVHELTQGEKSIGLHARQVELSLDRMRGVRDELRVQLDAEHTMNMHEQLQTLAEYKGLTVTRIEPLRKRVEKLKRGAGLGKLELESQEFRVECEGPYSGVVEYIEELSNGASIAKISSFRMLPTSMESVRMILQVSAYEIGEFPEAFDEISNSSGVVDPVSQVADAGRAPKKGGS
tara:strand:+ start:1010 stop:1669 length:660 start_codon:yes stop_codon:yes gene_type:complete